MHTLLRELEGALAPPRRSHMALIMTAVLACAAVAAVAVFFTRDRSAAASSDCGPAAEVFGSAWSVEQRKAVVARHKLDVEGMAAAAALDDLRAKWLAAYEATCQQPPSASRHERLGCLLEVRDDAKELTDELESDDGKLSIGAIIPLTLAMGMCGGSSTREHRDSPEIPEIKIPSVPSPSPPLPPSGHPDPWDSSSPPARSTHPTPPRPPVPPPVDPRRAPHRRANPPSAPDSSSEAPETPEAPE